MLLLGYDIGSSSVKATLLDVETGEAMTSATSPETELPIEVPRPGWAEQDPDVWWEHVQRVTATVLATADASADEVQGIGLAYQMHGLVIVGEAHHPLRPAIIWCDSRAVELGKKAFREIGPETCFRRFLNSPGNFTASKLAWVKQNEPQTFGRIHKAMLPGDYIALKMTGEVRTTPSGLSEGILWDVREQDVAQEVLNYFGLSAQLLPEVVPTFSEQGRLTAAAADVLGLTSGTPVAYRAGDQPNNALSLGVLHPGELAATAGTSGVIYGVSDQPVYDPAARVNTFLHVNHTPDASRYGVLLCINGTGSQNRWMHHHVAPGDVTYDAMNEAAAQIPVGAEGLVMLPFGNGAERVLEDRSPGASLYGLNFNVHGRAHLFRAAQEGIAFALNYGVSVLREMGLRVDTVRAGVANMFLSPLFAEAFTTTAGTTLELFRTDGSQGAARGAGIGAGMYTSPEEALDGLQRARTIAPDPALRAPYERAYARWLRQLEHQLASTS